MRTYPRFFWLLVLLSVVDAFVVDVAAVAAGAANVTINVTADVGWPPRVPRRSGRRS